MELVVVLVSCTINLFLGLFVLLRNQRVISSWAFFFMTFCICIWILSNDLTTVSALALAYNQVANLLAFASGYGAVASGVWFTYYFPIKRSQRRLEGVSVLILAIITIGLSFTPLISGNVFYQGRMLQFSLGPYVWMYVMSFVILLGLVVKNLLILPQSVPKVMKKQAHFVLMAFVFSALFGLVTNVLIPALSTNWQTTDLGAFSTVILVTIIVYAIARHGLFDIRLAVVRTTAYVLSLMTLAFFYIATAYTVSRLFLKDTSLLQPFSMVLALVLAFIFQPIKHFFDRLTSQLFYKDNYNIDDFLAQLNHLLTSTTDLRLLLEKVSDKISHTLKSEQVFFYIFLDEEKYISAGTKGHTKIASKDVVEHELTSVVITSQLPVGDTYKRLFSSYRIEITIPLISQGEILGYIYLGEHRSGGYTTRDIRALQTITEELIIAIQNAKSVHKVRELNETLQQRINEATRELRASNTQLQKLDEAKDEFMSMASHQLRTPLTTIKGYISMVVEGDAGEINDTQKKLLNQAFDSSERMVRLIGDFLNVSRLQTGKFLIEKRPTDLSMIIKEEVTNLQPSAEARGLSLHYRKPARIPFLMLDDTKIRQVIMNFTDNAIYYSKEHSSIKLELKASDHSVIFTVTDTGIGVPKDEQSHLFSKFFRAQNARRQRPDGTGVGLFLAKKVIDAHQGRVIFESVEGKGSTFGFELPLPRTSVNE